MTDALARPWCCPEPRCVVASQGANTRGQSLEVPQPGESFTCFGRAPQEVAFIYDGIEHKNDLNVCMYTSLKGMLRFQMNIDDLWLVARDYWTALRALAPVEFSLWGPPVPKEQA